MYLILVFVIKLNVFQNSGDLKQKWRPAPTRREQDKWDRAYKAATGGSVLPLLFLFPFSTTENVSTQSRQQFRDFFVGLISLFGLVQLYYQLGVFANDRCI